MNNDRVPYVYLVKNKTTGLKYIGSKYSKNCHPDLFWFNYFTSSKRVHQLIEMFGKDDFTFKILRVFTTEYEALKYENKLNKLAFYRDDYLNLHYNFIDESDSEEEYLTKKEKQRKSAKINGIFQSLNGIGIHGRSPEQRKRDSTQAGHIGAQINRILKRAIFDPAFRERQHQTLREKQVSAYYNPALRRELSSRGGKNGGFSKAYYERCGLTEEDRIEAQRSRGRRGGPKNKGFKWYNDGTSTYKYTKNQQEHQDFESFLAENPQFLRGRLQREGKRVWVNDGVKNSMIPEDEYDPSIHNKGRLGDRKKYNGRKNKANKED